MDRERHGKEPGIDQRVQRLVKALNAIPGVKTFSSCGGHPEPRIISQVPEDEFYVSFYLSPFRMARRALTLIAWAAAESRAVTKVVGGMEDASAMVRVWVNSDRADPRTLMFSVEGKHVPPDLLTEYLERPLAGQPTDPDDIMEFVLEFFRQQPE